jgi:N-acetyl-beta-hexosaminidase
MKSNSMINTPQTANGGKRIEIKHYSIAELADLYNLERRVFKKWLEPHLPVIGERIGHFYNIKQVKIIFDVLGLPGDYLEAN